jgi:uncharacterized protein involved in outer membrane biogenesis
MRWLLGGILVVLAVLTIAVGVLIYLVPATAIERHILTAVSRETQTDITSTGRPDITLFPSIEMVLRGVEIRSQSASSPTLKAREIEAQVSWLSLLTGWIIDVTKLRVIEPELSFQQPTAKNLEAAPPALLRKPSYAMPGLAIREASIERGRVTGLGGNWRIKDVDAEMKSVSLDRPMDVDFNMFLNGHRVIGALKLKNLAKILKGNRVPLVARLSAEFGSAEIDGAWQSTDEVLTANVKVRATDVDSTARWLGYGPVSEFAGKPAALEGRIRLGAKGILFKDAVVSIDEMTARIAGRIEQKGDDFTARDFTISDLDPKRLGVPERIDLKALRAHFDIVERGAPLTTQLEFDLNGQRVTGRATVPDLDLVQSGKHIPLKARFTVPGGDVEFDGEAALPPTGGTLEQADSWSAIGKLGLKTDSVRETASWLKFTLPQNNAYNAAEFEGDLTANGKSIKIADAKASFDATEASGNLVINMAGERTLVTGALSLDSIDTKRYLGAGGVGTAVSSGMPDQLERTVAVSPPYQVTLLPLKPSLEALLAGGAGPQLESLAPVPALTTAWSGAALGVDSLREAGSDLDLDLSVGDLRHGNIELGKTTMIAKLDNGILMLDLKEARPLQGQISGTMRINARTDKPAFNLDLDVNGVSVERVVRHAGQRDIIRGALTGQAKLSASGKSEADLIGTLKGELRGQVRDGAIVGYNVRKMIWPSSNRQYNPTQTTPFSVLKADFNIADGIARSPSIVLDGPSIRVRANGNANLRTSAIDYRSDLTLVPPPPGFSLPLKILGTWKKVKAGLDWLRFATEWSGPSPFPELETARRAGIGDAELKGLVEELIVKQGGKSLPPQGAAVLRQLTGKGR